jgi:hypothetical protein
VAEGGEGVVSCSHTLAGTKGGERVVDACQQQHAVTVAEGGEHTVDVRQQGTKIGKGVERVASSCQQYTSMQPEIAIVGLTSSAAAANLPTVLAVCIVGDENDVTISLV